MKSYKNVELFAKNAPMGAYALMLAAILPGDQMGIRVLAPFAKLQRKNYH